MEKELDAFYDATLDLFQASWSEGDGHLELRTWEGGSKQELLKFSGPAYLELNHHFPWGRSVSINSVKVRPSDGGGLDELEVEMQGGDLLRLRAGRFSLGDSGRLT